MAILFVVPVVTKETVVFAGMAVPATLIPALMPATLEVVVIVVELAAVATF